jgi:hypothetical protein
MRRAELLIADARDESLNKDYSATVGIPQDTFVRWLNEAVTLIHGKIVQTHPRFFLDEEIQSCVANQEAYDIPDDCFDGHIHEVWWSHDGSAQNYAKLEQISLSERGALPASNPGYYVRSGEQILLRPAAASASSTLRITYVRRRKYVDIRRAGIASRTFSTPTLSALTLSNLTTLDLGSQYANYNFLSVVDRSGEQVMAGVEYDSINSGTGVVTLTGGAHTADTGETITTSNYIVLGEDSTNLPELPASCEPYLVNFMIACALGRDGSVLEDKKRLLAEAAAAQVVQGFADIDHDTQHVTILSTDLMDFGDSSL